MQIFERETYPRLWKKAYELGELAQTQGLERKCNLTDKEFITPNGHILKVYKSAWEQGWNHYKIPEIFSQMEEKLNSLPTRPMKTSDFPQIQEIKERWLRIGQFDAGRSLLPFKNDIDHASQLAKWYVEDIHTLLKLIGD